MADAFDAMLSVRPYRAALPYEKAFEQIRTHNGTHYDPVIAGAVESLKSEMLAIASTFADCWRA